MMDLANNIYLEDRIKSLTPVFNGEKQKLQESKLNVNKNKKRESHEAMRK